MKPRIVPLLLLWITLWVAAAAQTRPNVVIFLADDAGWGDYSHSGNTQLRTPHIDSLARAGVSLDRFFVQPVCAPTRAEFLTGRYHPRGGVRGVSTGQERLDLSEKNQANPFLCYVPFTTPHSPWAAPEQDWERFKDQPITLRATDASREAADETRCALAMMENQDRNVGRVLAKLREHALEQNTIVIYFSDNGPNSMRWTGGMKGKKGTLDEGGVRSVCYVRWPAQLPAGHTVTQIAGAIDLLPTLTSLAGTTRMAALMVALSVSALCGGLELANDAATGRPGEFAVQEIRRAAEARGMTLGDDASATRIELTVGGGDGVAQSYRIRVQSEGGRRVITVHGADAAGAMYGGLDIAEAIRTGTLDALKDSDHQPHIARRGIKFNIPLDLRTPSYTDCSDAAQANIPEMWEREFWTEFLDAMARHRYNVLSLWSLHPFPSLVKVPEFPEVALADVWRTRARLDDTFSFAGSDMVRPEMLADHEVVKRLTMDEKIGFWRWVMQHAADRGIQVYFFTWNVFTWGAE
ncbi:MAG: sulfatase-like hydrolase/transferase, partial [Verrucomicrobia bacterium]|nr:sulfatase-like hydrolase/transferase [Verrucomicrobiota bacterium]